MAALVRQARRAGRVIVGLKMNREAAHGAKLAAVLIAEDLAAERRDTLIAAWRARGIAVHRGWTKDELGELVDRVAVTVLGVTDRNIAAGLEQIVSEPRQES